MTRVEAFAGIAAFALLAGAASGEPGQDPGLIACWISTIETGYDCDLLREGDPVSQAPSIATARAQVTLTWAPETAASRELLLSLLPDPSCEACAPVIVQGESPLVAVLEGPSALGAPVAVATGAHVCDYAGGFPGWVVEARCEMPLLRVIRDQPVTFSWAGE